MHIIVIGSVGNIGKQLTKKLVEKGHRVTGIDYKTESRKIITDLGAIPAIGDLNNVPFLNESFEGADAVFTMYPPINYLEPDLDIVSHYKRLSENYAQAISNAKVKRVVNLSSVGAHLASGNGVVKGAFYVEKILNALPPGISVTHIRPNSLYTNLYGYMHTIKSEGKIYASFGSKTMPWTSPIDLAAAVAEELSERHTTKAFRYMASDELTGDEVAEIIGRAINMPHLKWQMISNEEAIHKFKSAGMRAAMAAEVAEMYAALESGLMHEDFEKNKPQQMGNVKFKDFAQEFAAAYKKY
ncbi:NmrA family NAD(P)-binding protein [Olivibacter ginsenosidimutans]|uniref:NmrA family NAD(P)-binding protein n=1 Tax=Olivibacter ginsenosidimutans TaxID=1176537 RepID=A0ABP9BGY0_9SPHI